MSIKAVGRFIHRGCDANDGLLIGAAFHGNPFKPNTVYEVVDVLGQLTVREIGQSAILNMNEPRKSALASTWGSSIDELLVHRGATLVLTREEYAQVLYQRHREVLIKEYGAPQVSVWELQGKDLNDIQF